MGEAPNAFEELAVRCEAATGPDRFLGREILVACGKGYVSPLRQYMNPTSSLDAALSLVPDYAHWMCDNFDGPHDHRCTATVFGSGRSGGGAAYAVTPALALTAAALRARSAVTHD